jgi:protocatechuate 3,4-dioxygenase beta subunit
MTPQGVVSGRVTDANGDPIQSVQVALQRRAYQRGVRQLLTASSGSTNDQGEFRIANVAPGRYYIQATSRTDAILSNANGSQASTAAIPTFYPNATDPRGAAALDVAAGQELRGLEIQMRTGSVYSVSGKIVSGTGEALQNPRVMVLPRSGTNTIDTLILSQTLSLQQMRPDGSFQVRNLTPGPYTAQVVMPVNNQTRSMATFDFDITDKNVTDLVIATTAAAPITGSVRLEGGELKDLLGPAPAAGQSTTQTSAIELAIALDPAAAAAAGITLPAGAATRMSVGLQPMVSTPLGGNTSSQVYADGNIKLEGALPGRYYLGSAAPQGTYIKSVRFNGTDVTRTPIEVPRGGGGTLEILLAKNPAGISGTVQTEKGDPMPAVVVSLWPQDPDQASAAGGVRTFTTAQNGTFQAQGLRPGTYYVAAFEVIDSGLVQARDFLTQLTGDATKVELKEGSTPSVQLKVIPEAKIKAAEEKLP